MTIEIREPELEALIAERMQSGHFKSVEDVILHALRSSAPVPEMSSGSNSLDEMFAVVRGLADDLEFNRSLSTGRHVEL